MALKIAVTGAGGRMGGRILALAAESKEFRVAAAFEHARHPLLGKPIGGIPVTELSLKNLNGAEALIDFSSPEGAEEALSVAVSAGIPIVIGTTAVAPAGAQKIKDASKKIPVLFSPNMSVGANFLFELSRLAAQKLPAGYDIEIVEAHHHLKKDAPSGTAKKIAEAIAEAKGGDVGKVPIHSIRAGEIVGDHTVIFSGPGETIELVHRAQSRDAFARGALLAARFIMKKPAGLYAMSDVLK